MADYQLGEAEMRSLHAALAAAQGTLSNVQRFLAELVPIAPGTVIGPIPSRETPPMQIEDETAPEKLDAAPQ